MDPERVFVSRTHGELTSLCIEGAQPIKKRTSSSLTTRGSGSR